MANSESSTTRSPFAATIPTEDTAPAPVDTALAAPGAALPAVDQDVMALLAEPFRSDTDDQAASVINAITEVVTRQLTQYFPSTMNRQTSHATKMIVGEVVGWACPEGYTFSDQCTPESPSRSGPTKLPALLPLHVPTGADKYTGSEAVESHKLNRPFFKALGKISKATVWHALNETYNSPADPFSTDDTGSRRRGAGGSGARL